MTFQQKVILNNINPVDVVRSFHDYNFVKFLTFAQPIRIEDWSGINSNQEASFAFWFFGWRRIKVKHQNYKASEDQLHFQDVGLEMPFGLLSWKHEHVVEPYGEGVVIIDNLEMEYSPNYKKYFIFLLMIFPVYIRQFTYRVWFYFCMFKN